ncbi:MAG: hypothetical protein ACRDB0_01360 [Paraclostridium sp.]
MRLNKQEMIEVYKLLDEGKLKEKMSYAIYPHKETIDAIKKEFPDAHDIWKHEEANEYYVRFLDEEPEQEDWEDTRFFRAAAIEIESNPNVEVTCLEISDAERKWMYSGYDLVWEKVGVNNE